MLSHFARYSFYPRCVEERKETITISTVIQYGVVTEAFEYNAWQKFDKWDKNGLSSRKRCDFDKIMLVGNGLFPTAF